MKVLADENVPAGLVWLLRENSYDVIWIQEEAPSANDLDILSMATALERTLITFDSDFGTLVMRDGAKAPFGIIFPRLKRLNLSEQIARVFSTIVDQDVIGPRILVIEETKIRFRDLPTPEKK